MRDKDLFLNCLSHFKALGKKSQSSLTSTLMETKRADFVKHRSQVDLAESWRRLSPGSLGILAAVIHMTVLTWEQG